MADTRVVIDVDINTSAAASALRSLQSQINSFTGALNKNNTEQALASRGITRQLMDLVNTSKYFTAEMVRMQTGATQLDKTLSKGQVTMGQFFSAKFKKDGLEAARVLSLAHARAQSLQTQFVATSGAANGFRDAIAIRPLAAFNDAAAVSAQKLIIQRAMLQQATTSMINFGKNTQWAGRQLMVGFTIPLTIFAATAGKTFMDLEKQSLAFRKVYGDAFTTPEELNKNIEAVKQLSAEFTKYGIAVADTMELAAQAAAAGAKNADLIDATTEATRLATLGQLDLQAAMETTISLQSAFGLSGDKLTKSINFMNMVENQTVLTLQDLTDAIPRVAPVIQGLGGTVEDMAIMLTAMKEGGISAAQGANALKSGLASLINPTDRAIEKLQMMGINLNAIIKANRGDLMGTVQDFARALATLDEFGRQQALETVFGKFQYARLGALFNNIIRDGSQASRAMDAAAMSAGNLAAAANKELKMIEESPAIKFTAAMEKLKLAIAPIGEMFVKMATPIINFLATIADKFNNLPDFAKKFIAFGTVLVGIVIPAGTMFLGLLMNLIGTLTKFGHLATIFIKGFAQGGIRQALENVSQATRYMSLAEIDATNAAKQLSGATKSVNAALLEQVAPTEAATSAISGLAGAYDVLTRNMREAQLVGGISMQVPGTAMRNAAGRSSSIVGRPLPIVRRNRGGSIPYMSTGSTVPGVGNTDTVPAMLTPGEFVVNKQATQQNIGLLHAINNGDVQYRNKGGGIAQAGRSFYGIPPANSAAALARLQQFQESRQALANIWGLPATSSARSRAVSQTATVRSGAKSRDIYNILSLRDTDQADLLKTAVELGLTPEELGLKAHGNLVVGMSKKTNDEMRDGTLLRLSLISELSNSSYNPIEQQIQRYFGKPLNYSLFDSIYREEISKLPRIGINNKLFEKATRNALRRYMSDPLTNFSRDQRRSFLRDILAGDTVRGNAKISDIRRVLNAKNIPFDEQGSNLYATVDGKTYNFGNLLGRKVGNLGAPEGIIRYDKLEVGAEQQRLHANKGGMVPGVQYFGKVFGRPGIGGGIVASVAPRTQEYPMAVLAEASARAPKSVREISSDYASTYADDISLFADDFAKITKGRNVDKSILDIMFSSDVAHKKDRMFGGKKVWWKPELFGTLGIENKGFELLFGRNRKTSKAMWEELVKRGKLSETELYYLRRFQNGIHPTSSKEIDAYISMHKKAISFIKKNSENDAVKEFTKTKTYSNGWFDGMGLAMQYRKKGKLGGIQNIPVRRESTIKKYIKRNMGGIIPGGVVGKSKNFYGRFNAKTVELFTKWISSFPEDIAATKAKVLSDPAFAKVLGGGFRKSGAKETLERATWMKDLPKAGESISLGSLASFSPKGSPVLQHLADSPLQKNYEQARYWLNVEKKGLEKEQIDLARLRQQPDHPNNIIYKNYRTIDSKNPYKGKNGRGNPDGPEAAIWDLEKGIQIRNKSIKDFEKTVKEYESMNKVVIQVETPKGTIRANLDEIVDPSKQSYRGNQTFEQERILHNAKIKISDIKTDDSGITRIFAKLESSEYPGFNFGGMIPGVPGYMAGSRVNPVLAMLQRRRAQVAVASGKSLDDIVFARGADKRLNADPSDILTLLLHNKNITNKDLQNIARYHGSRIRNGVFGKFDKELGYNTRDPKASTWKQIADILDEKGYSVIQKRNAGGQIFESGGREIVPGVGNTDTVPAMLTPGEFVVNKEATRSNMPLLNAINSGEVVGFNRGGQIPGVQYFGFNMFPRVVQPFKNLGAPLILNPYQQSSVETKLATWLGGSMDRVNVRELAKLGLAANHPETELFRGMVLKPRESGGHSRFSPEIHDAFYRYAKTGNVEELSSIIGKPIAIGPRSFSKSRKATKEFSEIDKNSNNASFTFKIRDERGIYGIDPYQKIGTNRQSGYYREQKKSYKKEKEIIPLGRPEKGRTDVVVGRIALDKDGTVVIDVGAKLSKREISRATKQYDETISARKTPRIQIIEVQKEGQRLQDKFLNIRSKGDKATSKEAGDLFLEASNLESKILSRAFVPATKRDKADMQRVGEIIALLKKDLPSIFNRAKALGLNIGGTVPGVGNTDTVPAMLTPGEFVVNKQATQSNMALLHAINNGKVAGYATGGEVVEQRVGGIGKGASVQYVVKGGGGQIIGSYSTKEEAKAALSNYRKQVASRVNNIKKAGRGGTGGGMMKGMGGSMALGMAGMGVMMAGQKMEMDAAQQGQTSAMGGMLSTAGIGLSMASILPMIPGIMSPIGLAAVGIAAAAAGAGVAMYKFRDNIDTTARKMADLGSNVGGTANALNTMANLLGQQTPVQRQAQLQVGLSLKEQQQFVSEFSAIFESEAGAKFIEDLKSATSADRFIQLSQYLQNAIAAGMMDKNQAQVFAKAVGLMIGDTALASKTATTIRQQETGSTALLNLARSREKEVVSTDALLAVKQQETVSYEDSSKVIGSSLQVIQDFSNAQALAYEEFVNGTTTFEDYQKIVQESRNVQAEYTKTLQDAMAKTTDFGGSMQALKDQLVGIIGEQAYANLESAVQIKAQEYATTIVPGAESVSTTPLVAVAAEKSKQVAEVTKEAIIEVMPAVSAGIIAGMGQTAAVEFGANVVNNKGTMAQAYNKLEPKLGPKAAIETALLTEQIRQGEFIGGISKNRIQRPGQVEQAVKITTDFITEGGDPVAFQAWIESIPEEKQFTVLTKFEGMTPEQEQRYVADASAIAQIYGTTIQQKLQDTAAYQTALEQGKTLQFEPALQRAKEAGVTEQVINYAINATENGQPVDMVAKIDDLTQATTDLQSLPEEMIIGLGIDIKNYQDLEKFGPMAQQLIKNWEFLQNLNPNINMTAAMEFLTMGPNGQLLSTKEITDRIAKLNIAWKNLSSSKASVRKQAEVDIATAYAGNVIGGDPVEMAKNAMDDLRDQFKNFDKFDPVTRDLLIQTTIKYDLRGVQLALDIEAALKAVENAKTIEGRNEALKLLNRFRAEEQSLETERKGALTGIASNADITTGGGGGGGGSGQKSLLKQLQEELKALQNIGIGFAKNLEKNKGIFKGIIAGPFGEEFINYLISQGDKGIKILKEKGAKFNQAYQTFIKIQLQKAKNFALQLPSIFNQQKLDLTGQTLVSKRLEGQGFSQANIETIMQGLPEGFLASYAMAKAIKPKKRTKREQSIIDYFNKQNMADALKPAKQLNNKMQEQFITGKEDALTLETTLADALSGKNISPEVIDMLIEMGWTSAQVEDNLGKVVKQAQRLDEVIKTSAYKDSMQGMTDETNQLNQSLTLMKQGIAPDAAAAISQIAGSAQWSTEQLNNFTQSFENLKVLRLAAQGREAVQEQILASNEKIRQLQYEKDLIESINADTNMAALYVKEGVTNHEDLLQVYERQADIKARELELEQRKLEPIDEQIKILEESIKTTEDFYNTQLENLDQIITKEEEIFALRQKTLGIADALSRGDIAAAAQAALDFEKERAAQRSSDQKSLIEKQRQEAISTIEANITTQKDKRKVIEDEILRIQKEQRSIADQIYNVNFIISEQAARLEDYYQLGNNKLIELTASLASARKEAEDLAKAALIIGGIEYKSIVTPPPAAAPAVPAPAAPAAPAAPKPMILPGFGIVAVPAAPKPAAPAVPAPAAPAAPKPTILPGFGIVAVPAKRKFGGAIPYRVPMERAPGFSFGGKIKGYAAGSYVSGYGLNDTVPAMLTPGEFIVRKPVAQAYGPLLESLNSNVFPRVNMNKAMPSSSTQNSGSMYNYNVNVTLNGSDMDPDDVANVVMQKIKMKDSMNIRSYNYRG